MKIKKQTDVYKYGRILFRKGWSKQDIRQWCSVNGNFRDSILDSLMDELWKTKDISDKQIKLESRIAWARIKHNIGIDEYCSNHGSTRRTRKGFNTMVRQSNKIEKLEEKLRLL